jgi:CheY-like chemotaxis protein
MRVCAVAHPASLRRVRLQIVEHVTSRLQHDRDIVALTHSARAEPFSSSLRIARKYDVRILIVDHDLESTHSLRLLLHGLGYHTTRIAYTGATALEMAREFLPDIVLLELELPDLNGYQVAQSMREQAQSRKLRLIAVTANREYTGRELAREAGFERYLLKPVGALALDELLRDQE